MIYTSGCKEKQLQLYVYRSMKKPKDVDFPQQHRPEFNLKLKT